MDKYDVIIIGAGPAGLTAGIYAGRAGLNTLILEKLNLGGRVLLTEKIENFPGVGKEILSFDFIKNIEEQIHQFENVKIVYEEVKSIDVINKRIFTDKKHYDALGVIVASGARERKLNVKGEAEFLGKGVSYCALCDGYFYKDKEVAVVGGGDSALEEALYLSKICKKVYLIHRRDVFRGSKILQKKVMQTSNIQPILNSIVLEIRGDKFVESVLIKDKVKDKEILIPLSGIFIYVGIEPNTDFLKGLINMDENGFIITDENMATSHKGIFACGDCRKKSLYQIISACSEGATALNSLNNYLLNL
jgi:thioredoxin reductase (NADPH)